MMIDTADDTPRKKAISRKKSQAPQKNKKQGAAGGARGRGGISGDGEGDAGDEAGTREGTARLDDGYGTELAEGAEGELPSAERAPAAPTGSAAGKQVRPPLCSVLEVGRPQGQLDQRAWKLRDN